LIVACKEVGHRQGTGGSLGRKLTVLRGWLGRR
jgi:hypothetical protein